MFLARRTGGDSPRFLSLRVGLFFLAAGVWLAGVIIEDERFTGAAIVILSVALVLGLVGRRQEAHDVSLEEPAEPEREERL